MALFTREKGSSILDFRLRHKPDLLAHRFLFSDFRAYSARESISSTADDKQRRCCHHCLNSTVSSEVEECFPRHRKVQLSGLIKTHQGLAGLRGPLLLRLLGSSRASLGRLKSGCSSLAPLPKHIPLWVRIRALLENHREKRYSSSLPLVGRSRASVVPGAQ